MTLDEDKMDKTLTPYLDQICKQYPCCEAIRSIFKTFHDIIIVDERMYRRTEEKQNKALEQLDAFIEEHKKADDPLKGFASSLKSDLECIRNAITMPYNSGAVEGRNCKYKETLRTSYGHVPVETLEQKLKLGFMYTGKDFSIGEIAPWLMSELPAQEEVSVLP